MGIKQRLIRLTTGTLIQTGRVIGPGFAMRLADRLARRYKLDPRLNKKQLRENLRQFFPERDEAWIERTAREVQANAVRAKTFDKHFLPKLSADEFDRMVDVVGLENLERVLDAGRGAVCVMMHYGRFWAAGVWCSRRGYNTTAFQSAAGRLPSASDTLSGGSFNANDPHASLKAVRALKKGAVTFLLLDAGKVANPVTAQFMGQPTHFSTAAVRLAKAADAVIIPVLVPVHPDDPNRIRLTFHDPVDPRDLPPDAPLDAVIRRCLDPFEAQVRTTPSQWYGFLNAHRRLARDWDQLIDEAV